MAENEVKSESGSAAVSSAQADSGSAANAASTVSTTTATPTARTPAQDAAKANPAAPPPAENKHAGPSSAQEAKKKLGNAAKGLGTKIKNLAIGLLTFPFFIFRGPLGTRLQGLAFALSVGFLVWGLFGVYNRFVAPRLAPSSNKSDTSTGEGKELGAFLKNQKELTIAAQNVVFLERFSAQLSPSRSRARLMEVEIAVELDDPKTSQFVKAKFIQIKEAVSIALQGKSYEEMLQESGKENLKKEIIKSINEIFEKNEFHGQVERVFFTRFVMATS